jgi:hypothetical protein
LNAISNASSRLGENIQPSELTNSLVGIVCRNKPDDNANSLQILATPARIEPATNSLEVIRKASNFNAHSDKIAAPAALSNMTKFQFIGMS